MASTNLLKFSICLLWALLQLHQIHSLSAANAYIKQCKIERSVAPIPDAIKLDCSPNDTPSVDLTAAIRNNATLHCENGTINVPDINRLILTNCEFDTLPRRLLDGFTSLQQFYLINMQLRSLRVGDIPPMPPSASGPIIMQTFNANIGHIEDGAFGEQRAMQSLVLRNNRLYNLSAGTFTGLGGLKMLDLSWNEHAEIAERAFYPLHNVTELHLSSNQLQRIDGTWFDVGNSMEKLFMVYNRIQRLDRSDFAQLRGLQELHLTGNAISKVENRTFERLVNLGRLNLSGNRVRCIGDWFNATNQLAWLDLSSNNITQLDRRSLAQFRSVGYLGLRANRIAEIPRGAFEPLANLTKLDLDHNKLERINGPWFGRENRLTNLALSHNNIGQLLRNDFEHLASLRTLVMSGCTLALIEDGAFAPLRALQNLDLSDNRLTTFDSSRLFHSAPDRLEMLRLSSNRISELFIDTKQLVKLTVFDIISNRLDCTRLEMLITELAKAKVLYPITDYTSSALHCTA